MKTFLTCPECGRKLALSGQIVAASFRCPSCQAMIQTANAASASAGHYRAGLIAAIVTGCLVTVCLIAVLTALALRREPPTVEPAACTSPKLARLERIGATELLEAFARDPVAARARYNQRIEVTGVVRDISIHQDGMPFITFEAVLADGKGRLFMAAFDKSQALTVGTQFIRGDVVTVTGIISEVMPDPGRGPGVNDLGFFAESVRPWQR